MVQYPIVGEIVNIAKHGMNVLLSTVKFLKSCKFKCLIMSEQIKVSVSPNKIQYRNF